MSGCFYFCFKWIGVYIRIGNLVGKFKEWLKSELFMENKFFFFLRCFCICVSVGSGEGIEMEMLEVERLI